MKFNTITIGETSSESTYKLKKNIKVLSVIGVRNVVGSSFDCVKIVINKNQIYYSKLGLLLYFCNDGIYIEDIEVYILFDDFQYNTEATLIYEES